MAFSARGAEFEVMPVTGGIPMFHSVFLTDQMFAVNEM